MVTSTVKGVGVYLPVTGVQSANDAAVGYRRQRTLGQRQIVVDEPPEEKSGITRRLSRVVQCLASSDRRATAGGLAAGCEGTGGTASPRVVRDRFSGAPGLESAAAALAIRFARRCRHASPASERALPETASAANQHMGVDHVDLPDCRSRQKRAVRRAADGPHRTYRRIRRVVETLDGVRVQPGGAADDSFWNLPQKGPRGSNQFQAALRLRV